MGPRPAGRARLARPLCGACCGPAEAHRQAAGRPNRGHTAQTTPGTPARPPGTARPPGRLQPGRIFQAGTGSSEVCNPVLPPDNAETARPGRRPLWSFYRTQGTGFSSSADESGWDYSKCGSKSQRLQISP